MFLQSDRKIKKIVDSLKRIDYYVQVNKKWKEEVPTSRPIDSVGGQMSQRLFFKDKWVRMRSLFI
ncbi:MAG TPA: hypothetical protein DCL62_01930 [Kandleria vitulina]|nr:hypothetical protein [Kandleria vitulina]